MTLCARLYPLIRVVVGTVCLALAAAGCGGDGSTPTSPTVNVPFAQSDLRIGTGADGRAVLVLARELERGSRYTLLEREGPTRWTVRWTSARRGGC